MTSSDPPGAPLTLSDLSAIPIDRLRGVGEARRRALSADGVDDVLDLLTTYPRRWIDRSRERRIIDLEVGDESGATPPAGNSTKLLLSSSSPSPATFA